MSTSACSLASAVPSFFIIMTSTQRNAEAPAISLASRPLYPMVSPLFLPLVVVVPFSIPKGVPAATPQCKQHESQHFFRRAVTPVTTTEGENLFTHCTRRGSHVQSETRFHIPL